MGSVLNRAWKIRDFSDSHKLSCELKYGDLPTTAAFRTKAGLLWVNFSDEPEPGSDRYLTRKFGIFRPDPDEYGKYNLVSAQEIDGHEAASLRSYIDKCDEEDDVYQPQKAFEMTGNDSAARLDPLF